MAIPSLAMIPSGYKDGKVYSVLPANGDGDFDFSRGSNARRRNKDGLIETVTGDTPRLDYTDSSCPSLLLEPQRTNLVSYSEDFSNSYWTKLNSSITSNSIISPDGSLNASSFTQSGGTAEHSIYHTLPTLTSGVEYTGSVFLKYDDWQYFQIRFRAGGFGAEIGVIYDAINKTITTTSASLLSYKVEEYADDWVRISIIAQSTSASNFAGLVVAYNNSGNVFNDPDGVPNTGANAYVWGFQVEQGSYPTSYIPTSGSTATRLADECNNGGNADTFNDSEGVLYLEGYTLINGQDCRITLSDSSISNRVSIEWDSLANTIKGFMGSNGLIQTTSVNQTSNNKIALSYKENDFKMFINGVEIGVDTDVSEQVGLNKLSFDNATGNNPFYGNVKDLRVYNTALTDEELAELTKV